MYAVIFEVEIKEELKSKYLEVTTKLKNELIQIEGFLYVERFQSLIEEGKILSLSFWETKEAIGVWKNSIENLIIKTQNDDGMFKSYRIRVAEVKKDFAMSF